MEENRLFGRRVHISVTTPKGFHYGGKVISEDAEKLTILDEHDGITRQIRRDVIAVLEVLS